MPDQVPDGAREAMIVALNYSIRTASDTPIGDAVGAQLAALSAAGYAVVSRDLLESLVEADNCWFDHHGGCQAHGYLSLEPGEQCPQQELKNLLRAHSSVSGEEQR